ncbi:ABC transporter permease [Thermovibrio sp.]
MKWKRVWGIVKKEVKELLRDPLGLATFLMVPVLIMVILGYGMKLEVKRVPFGVFDLDKSSLSREIAGKFKANREYFDFRGEVSSYKKGIDLITDEKIRFLLVFPPKFEEKFKEGKNTRYQAIIDGTFPYRATVIKSYVEGITVKENLDRLKLQNVLKVKSRYWFNESLNQDYIVAVGTLAVVLLISPAVFSALLIVKEKEMGSIYNVYSSPITKGEFLTGKLLAGFTISIPVFLICYGMTVLLFGVPQKGSTLLMVIGSLIYVAVSVSFGLLISNLFSSQAAAFIGTAILTVVPSVLYSGYITPVSSMDKSGYITAHLIPTFYYLKFIKGIFFKGASFSVLWRELAVLTLFLVSVYLITYVTFKKREK